MLGYWFVQQSLSDVCCKSGLSDHALCWCECVHACSLGTVKADSVTTRSRAHSGRGLYDRFSAALRRDNILCVSICMYVLICVDLLSTFHPIHNNVDYHQCVHMLFTHALVTDAFRNSHLSFSGLLQWLSIFTAVGPYLLLCLCYMLVKSQM